MLKITDKSHFQLPETAGTTASTLDYDYCKIEKPAITALPTLPPRGKFVNVLVQGAPRPFDSHDFHEDAHFHYNCGDGKKSDYDILVDVHRQSLNSCYFPKAKRCYMTFESPLYVPYFADLHNVDKLSTRYMHVYTSNCFMYSLPNCHRAQIFDKWAKERTPEGKQYGVSAMFSAKTGLPAYEIRHDIIRREAEIKIPNKIFHQGKDVATFPLQCTWALPSKDPAFEWCFSFAIENCAAQGYFTEKLVDCFATHTIPIYYGDPDVGEIFNPDGIIVLDPAHWLEQVNALTPDDYMKRQDAVRDNYERSKRFWSYTSSLYAALKETNML